jgi:hypothetical protein
MAQTNTLVRKTVARFSPCRIRDKHVTQLVACMPCLSSIRTRGNMLTMMSAYIREIPNPAVKRERRPPCTFKAADCVFDPQIEAELCPCAAHWTDLRSAVPPVSRFNTVITTLRERGGDSSR